MKRRSFLARVWAALLAHERRGRLLAPGRGVLAAVSGGPDSTVLAHWLARRSRAVGFPLALAHVHHGLRGRDADRDAAAARALAAALGLPFLEARVDARAVARAERRSREDAARAARYRALESLARRSRSRVVATGHTLSDHAETVLLHLLRGTRPEGLLGIPAKRPLASGVELVRPLLALTRADVAAYLAFFGLKAREDRSNRDESLSRNWVRRRVVPLLKTRSPRLESHLALLSEELGRRLRREGRGRARSPSRASRRTRA